MSRPLDIRDIAARIPHATVSGTNSLTFRPPWHRSTADRSASLSLSRQNPAGFIVNSFSGDDFTAVRDYVKERLGIGGTDRLPVPEGVAVAKTDSVGRALAIWQEAIDPGGTPVELYLRNRGLMLPNDGVGVLRYHPRCPFGPGVRAPCMVALVRSLRGDEPIGIQRTALTADGHKSLSYGDPKRVLGTMAGGAVKLTADEEVTFALGVAEGVENALAMALAPEFGQTPAWALLGTSGLYSAPVLAGVDVLWIAVDRDPAGETAARAAADRWAAEGREVRLIQPRQLGADLNDCTGGRV
ncbi:DUF7146 domain-containing protein [Methylobacterium sp. A54F]